MTDSYLIDFAYRNICFLNFLDTALIYWEESYREYNDALKNNKTIDRQKLFKEKNVFNLRKYNLENKISSERTKETYITKANKVNEWARLKNLKLSKEITIDEMNYLIDKYLFPQIINQITSLKKQKNLILQFLFPQLIDNLFESFELLNKLKMALFDNLKEETKKYNILLLESDAQDEKLKQNKIEFKKAISAFQKEKIDCEAKIKSMDAIIKKLEIENDSLRNSTLNRKFEELKYMNEKLMDLNNELCITNENNAFDLKALKSEIKSLKKEKEKILVDLREEKAQRMILDEKLKVKGINIEEQISFERAQRIKLKCDLDFEIEKRIKFEKELNVEKSKSIKMEKELNIEKEHRIKLEVDLNKLMKDLDIEKTQKEKIENDLKIEIIHREKIENELKNEKNERLKMQKNIMDLLEKNKMEILNQMNVMNMNNKFK